MFKHNSDFPKFKIFLSFLPGSENAADALTKYSKDLVSIINSKLYREGPEILCSGDIAGNTQVFLEVFQGDFTYTPIGTPQTRNIGGC